MWVFYPNIATLIHLGEDTSASQIGLCNLIAQFGLGCMGRAQPWSVGLLRYSLPM